ncbi:unnamed protein product [Brachionus calyciflorus]|uniref:Uncharacterized protein n=1 Tax=Brachionus calyciflorus TaxID=104777 RepID=A0A814HVY5_9BILA|nr:unnamed protein product [Brachionus calyciflorus]
MHGIGCSYRLKLMNFNKNGMNIPIRRKRGAQSKTKSASERQPSDVVQPVEAQIESEDENIQSKRTYVEAQQIVSNEILPTTSKNHDKLCETCYSKMLKKRGFYCQNRCTKLCSARRFLMIEIERILMI